MVVRSRRGMARFQAKVTVAITPGTPLSLDQWQALSPLQRFALIKLSQAGHEHRNFALALAEFGLESPKPNPPESVEEPGRWPECAPPFGAGSTPG